ncbi:MAG: TetR/AcrR family transcriptional regulator [Bacteroidales bacterium]|nr:TetR/AcrR family transcriptional regulator [Bacteroidales bacterium]
MKETKNTGTTREKIVDAALKLFREKESCSVTMDEVARSIHISKRTLYETFKDKEELIDACCQKTYTSVGSFMNRIAGEIDDPMMAIIFLVKACALQTVRYGRLMQDLRKSYPAIHERYVPTSRETNIKHLLCALQKAQDNGEMLEVVNVNNLSRLLAMLGPLSEITHPSNTNKQILSLNLAAYLLLRGALTAESIVRYDNMEKSLRQKLELMDENVLSNKLRLDELLNSND